MIKLIDPKRQAELEDVIVHLQTQVTQLVREVQRLQESNRRNQRDMQELYKEVRESFRPKTVYRSVNPWDTPSAGDWGREFICSDIPPRTHDERESYKRLRDDRGSTLSGYVRLDGTPVSAIRGSSGHTVVDDIPVSPHTVSFMDWFTQRNCDE